VASTSCIIFAVQNTSKQEFEGKRVLEVGSFQVAGTGSLRPIIESWNPAEYIGIDILMGAGVDMILNAEDVVKGFGKESFDVIVSTEVLEHVEDWRRVISNLKNACKPHGFVVISTRSFGYGYHAYPYDFWRYELEDIQEIFSDCEILALKSDPQSPGIFAKVRKPGDFVENDLSDYELYSVVVGKRCKRLARNDIRRLRLIPFLMKENVRRALKYCLYLFTRGTYRVVLIRESSAHEKTLVHFHKTDLDFCQTQSRLRTRRFLAFPVHFWLYPDQGRALEQFGSVV
jgi:SAM-dependent methyltransferase